MEIYHIEDASLFPNSGPEERRKRILVITAVEARRMQYAGG